MAQMDQSPTSGVSASVKKIVGSFNLQLDKGAVDKLKKDHVGRSPGGK